MLRSMAFFDLLTSAACDIDVFCTVRRRFLAERASEPSTQEGFTCRAHTQPTHSPDRASTCSDKPDGRESTHIDACARPGTTL